MVRGALDKVLMSIPLLSSASSALPSLVQTISGAGKPAAEQDRVVLSPTEITVAGSGCSVKMALTARRSRRMKKRFRSTEAHEDAKKYQISTIVHCN